MLWKNITQKSRNLFKKEEGKRKMYVFSEILKDHRALRFQEEGKKMGVDVKVVNMYKIFMQDGKMYDIDGTEIEVEKGSVAWILSNSVVSHYIAETLSEKLVWPDVNSVKFADKFSTNAFFSRIDMTTPSTVLLNSYEVDGIVEKVGGFPCIIKRNIGTVGKFVEIVNNKEEVKIFIEDNFDSIKANLVPVGKAGFLLQKYIEESKGVDYRVLCLDGEVLGVIKREAQEGFKSNVSLGGKATIVPTDEKLKKYALKIMKEGNLFYAGIDFMKVGDDYTALEVNTSAQFKGFEAATGINVAEKIIERLIEKRVN
ncbi:RimK family alpha-L-glutamate ligase [Patescibacteria group bacterium]